MALKVRAAGKQNRTEILFVKTWT